MEPVSLAFLLALASGAAGTAGEQAWDRLAARVRRPRRQTALVSGPSSGEGEAELERYPADERQARALSAALTARAGMDADFAAALDTWHQEAQRAVSFAGAGNVAAHISGRSQGNRGIMRDMSGGVSFGAPSARPDRPDESHLAED